MSASFGGEAILARSIPAHAVLHAMEDPPPGCGRHRIPWAAIVWHFPVKDVLGVMAIKLVFLGLPPTPIVLN